MKGGEKKCTRVSLRLLEKNKAIARIKTVELKQNVKEFIKNMAPVEDKNENLTEIIKMLMSKNDKINAECFEKIIPTYDGKSVPIKQWLENFEKNADAYDLTEKQKYVHARNKMCGLAQLFLESITVGDYGTLKNELYNEFHKDLDSAEVHEKLRNRKKQDRENFHEFVLQMKKIAALGKIEESAVIKYVVEGLSITNDAKYLLYTSKSIKELYEKYDIVEKLSKVKTAEKYVGKGNNNKNYPKSIHYFNGGSTAHKRNECNASTKCFKCNENGHISKNCPKAIKGVNVVIDRKRVKYLMVNGVQVEGLIDTGADVTILKHSVFQKMNGVWLQRSPSVLRGLGNIRTHPVGEFVAEAAVDGLSVSQRFVVVPDVTINNDALLGYDFIQKFRFICDEEGFKFSALTSVEEEEEKKQMSIYNVTDTNNNIVVPPQHKDEILQMISDYNPQPLEKCQIQLKIIPNGEIIRFHHAPSRLPAQEADAVNEQINEWLDKGIIRKSSSPVASRLVIVKKKDGTPRICVDFRKLNSMVMRDCFPVPVMEDVFMKLQEARYFTVMDLENGFFHLPLEETSKKYTAFVTKEGLFEFNVAPFGFCNSPAVFIRYVNYIFQTLINTNVMELYMDDIIIFAKTPEECQAKLQMVLQKAGRYNLKIKWKKCRFIQTKIDFLGHVISEGKIWPGHEKTNAVYKFKTPTNIKSVQAFLGLTGFFRKFIPGYANIARPLTNLLKKDVPFEIGTAETHAISQLKNALTKEPVLRIYSRNAPTEVHTDASKDGFGGALLQVYEGQLHPVFYWSKKTSEQEAQRHSYILEVKAAYLAVKKFRIYLLGIPFKLVTDCIAFKHSTSKSDIPREVAQWILYLQDFEYTVEHRAGQKLKHVDFLSRFPTEVLVVTAEVAARIKVAQEKDGHVKAVKEILKDRPYEDYKTKGGLLYKTVEGHEVLVIPKSMETEIIKEAHNVGHFALRKTMHSIRQNFWIPHLENKITKVIGNCIKCIIHNKKVGKEEGFLHCIDKGDVPLHTLHVDHLGPIDATAKQYKYIFAAVDAFSKFVWLYPTNSTGGEEVVRRLNDWSAVFGNPVRIVSDRGAAFTSNIYKDYLKTKNIDYVVTTTGVARGNGQIERVNRSILSIIAKLSTDDTAKWYKFVPQVQTAINSHVHSSTKMSPFQLMFGVKMNNMISDNIIQLLEQEIAENFDAERRTAREDAKQQIRQAQAAYKRNYDKKRKQEYGYKEGDLVAIKRTQFVTGEKTSKRISGAVHNIKGEA